MIDSAVVRHAAEISRVVQGLPGSGTTELEDTIIRSWTRCTNDYRIDPVSHAKPNVIDQAAVRERLDQHEDLVTIAAAEMDVLFDQIGASGNALLLTDASGVILHARVDPTLSDMFRGAGLLLGADWSERCEGTNGMGTCIAEGKPVTVHRAEHFRAHHTGLSCTAAPIRNSAGEVIAVLDASCVGATDSRTSQMHMVALVKLSAQVIEKCFFLRSHQRHGVLRFHYRPELVNVLHDGALALAGDGTVIAADYTAVRLLGVQDRYALVGRPVNEIFDARIDEFLPLHAHGGDDLWSVRDVRGGHRYFVSLHSAGCGIRADQLAPPALRPRTVVRLPSTKLATHAATLEELAGEDPQMLRNVRSARRIVDSGVAVLLQGPTGSGKEAFALAMHQASSRAQQPFVAVNCAAIPETLIESELFGYKAGAFTGARKDGMKGKILQSSGGTLFLDEIGDMPLTLQTRLLRILEQREIVPLGSESPLQVDLHVLTASHCNLREMIAQGTFREDLYYRINGITLEMPALAARADKDHMIRRVLAAETSNGRPAAIEMDALQRLVTYGWPGNIRELRNVIRTALAICDGGVIREFDLPREIRELPVSPAAARAALLSREAPADAAGAKPANALQAAERVALLRAIEDNRWNMTHAAQQLGMSRNTLYRKMKRHEIPLHYWAREGTGNA